MQIILGLLLVIVSEIIRASRGRKPGEQRAKVLSKPWILGQGHVMVALVIAVVGVSLVVNGWPAKSHSDTSIVAGDVRAGLPAGSRSHFSANLECRSPVGANEHC
jgi:hypothetical protein